MPGTRTAPAITAAATYKRVSIHWVDNSGEVRSDSANVPVGATAAQIEAVIVALQAASNASVYQVDVSEIRLGAKSSANALNVGRSPSVFDNIVGHFKDDVTTASQRLFIPAPIEAVMVVGTDTPDVSTTELSDLVVAGEAMLAGAYDIKSYRYSERRDINTKVNL